MTNEEFLRLLNKNSLPNLIKEIYRQAIKRGDKNPVEIAKNTLCQINDKQKIDYKPNIQYADNYFYKQELKDARRKVGYEIEQLRKRIPYKYEREEEINKNIELRFSYIKKLIETTDDVEAIYEALNELKNYLEQL